MIYDRVARLNKDAVFKPSGIEYKFLNVRKKMKLCIESRGVFILTLLLKYRYRDVNVRLRSYGLLTGQ